MTKSKGKVYLIGAGPGDPELVTLRAARCLARADVVLYDYLANAIILEHAQIGAELICLGRHGQGRILSQDEINSKLIALAAEGKTVARLKGGDPAVFARTAEEIDALAAAEIPFEIVPGVTVGLAVGSYLGVSLTHRESASAVALVTGQETGDKQSPSLDYEALARFPGTIVLYMGVTTANDWTSRLIAAGMSADTPVAIVRRCTWPNQQTIRCTLTTVCDELAKRNMRPPVVMIIGEVARDVSATSWFTERPLFGRRILLTRPESQVADVRQRLTELGADVLTQPVIQVSDPDDWSAVDAAISRLDDFDWLAFSSSNGVHKFVERVIRIRGDVRPLAAVKIAAIGARTAESLEALHIKADLVPDEYRAEALAAALIANGHVAGKRMLLARASRGREVLAETLQAADAQVEQIVVYRSTDVARLRDEVTAALESQSLDWVTVTSSAIARSLVSLCGDRLGDCKLASISPITSDTLRQLGHEPAAEATTYTADGVVDAIVRAEAETLNGN